MSQKKPVQLTINKVRLTRRAVIVEYANNGETLSIRSPENPLPEFKAAIEALIPLIIQICHFPETYAANMRASGLTITEKGLVTLQAAKSFDDASGPLNITTPLRMRELPEEEGTYSVPLDPAQKNLIDSVVEEAKRYVMGERAQGTLPLPEDGDDDEETGGEEKPLEESNVLPLEGEPAVPTKKRRTKKET